MSKVYVCVAGDYSDTRVAAVFTKREDAETCAGLFYWEVEEHDLDTIDPRSFPEGKRPWRITINAPWRDGNYSTAQPLRVDVYLSEGMPSDTWTLFGDAAYVGVRRTWRIITWAADDKEARAIADAKILELRAAGEKL